MDDNLEHSHFSDNSIYAAIPAPWCSLTIATCKLKVAICISQIKWCLATCIRCRFVPIIHQVQLASQFTSNMMLLLRPCSDENERIYGTYVSATSCETHHSTAFLRMLHNLLPLIMISVHTLTGSKERLGREGTVVPKGGRAGGG